MFKKTLCVILALCTLLSLFALPVLAAETSEAAVDRSADISRGEELGFGDFIDVEMYANNAGMPGFNSLTVLRIDIPEVSKSMNADGVYFYDWSIPVYFYNPEQLNFFVSGETNSNAITNSSALVQDLNDSSANTCLLYFNYLDSERGNYAATEYMVSFMFFKATVRGRYYSSAPLESDEGSYYFDSIVFDAGMDLNHFNRLTIPIDKTMKLEGIDHKIDVTNPDYDLSAFFDVDQKEIAMQYPADKDGEVSLAYVYEREYGTEDYGLYMYLYNPAGLTIKPYGMQLGGKTVHLVAYMNFGGNSISTRYFTVVSTSDTLIKLKCLSALPHSGEMDVRDYYVSRLCFFTADGSYNELDIEAHYEYSGSPLTDVEKLQFEYTYMIDGIHLGQTFDDGIYAFLMFLDMEKDYTIYLAGSNGLEPLFGLVWNDEHGCYAASTMIDGSSLDGLIDERGYLKPIYLKSTADFPSIKFPSLSATFYLASELVERGKTEELKLTFDSIEYSCIGRSANEAAVMLLSDDEGSSSGTGIYMRSDSKQELEIKCDSTFYRINSSASGKAYQSTLSTVGFALSESYFNMDDDDVNNNSYLDFIHFTCREGYLKPAFVTTDTDFLKNNDFMIGPGGYWLNDGYIASNYKKDETVVADILVTETYSDIWFGGYNASSYNKFFIDKHYYYIPFVFVVESWEDFEYVLTQEQIEAQFSGKMDQHIFDGAVVPVDKTITFKDKTELLSYRDATFDQVRSDLGFFSALWHKWFGMDDTVMESIGNINCIEMILPDEYQRISRMSDKVFSDTYLVALNEAAYIKQQVLDALSKNQVYTFFRFDTYDYYAADATISGLEHNGDSFIFQEKYYKDFDIIELGISNEQETIVYNVKMDPIDVMAGATSDDVVTKDDVTDPGEHIKEEFEDWWPKLLENLKKIGKIAAIVAGVVVFVAVVFGITKLVIYIRNTNTLNKMRRQIKGKDKQQRRKRK